MKECKACSSIKELTEFPKVKTNLDGRSGTCNKCRYATRKAKAIALGHTSPNYKTKELRKEYYRNNKVAHNLTMKANIVKAKSLSEKLTFGEKVDAEQDSFWSKVDIKGDSECWEWKGRIDGRGYGAFTVLTYLTVRAHRASYYLANKKISDDKVICHKCDNPKCVNPNHLFEGTAKENTHDMVMKNRHSHKLEKEDVLYIRESTESNVELAKIFNVTHTTIGHIKNNKTWGHLS